MNIKKIGNYLAEIRKYYKITQDELANRLGISRQAISKWETGASMPDIEILMMLSELYGVTINEIIQADTSEIKYKKEIHLLDAEKKNKKIAVVGCGRWGTFISWYLDKIGHSVTLYGRKNSKNFLQLLKTRKKNTFYCKIR